jgi:hypothetical protein
LDYNSADVKKCLSDKHSVVYTAGQRQNPSDCKSDFVWKFDGGETMPMEYTNWASGEPNCASNKEACHVYDRADYTKAGHLWNDIDCSGAYCSLCEESPLVFE